MIRNVTLCFVIFFALNTPISAMQKKQHTIDTSVSLLSGSSKYTLFPFILTESAKDGDTQMVQAAIKCGVPVNSRDAKYLTPLMLAAGNGRAAATIVLIRYGADLNAQNKQQFTALMICMQQNQEDTAQLLINHGSNLLLTNFQGFNACDLSIFYNRLRATLAMLKAGYKPQPKQALSWLHNFASDGRTKLVKQLIDSRIIDINQLDNRKANALLYAANMGRAETVRALIHSNLIPKTQSLTHRDINNFTALEYAISKGFSQTTAILLGEFTNDEIRPDKLTVGRLLTAAKESKNLKTRKLVVSKLTGWHTALFEAIKELNIEEAKSAIKQIHNIHIYNANGNTPLHEAMLADNIEMIGLLLSICPHLIDIPNKKNETPLDLALGRSDGFQVVKLITQLAGKKTENLASSSNGKYIVQQSKKE